MEPVKANTLNLFTLPSSVQKDILDGLEASNLISQDPTTGERLVGAKREVDELSAPYVELHCASERKLEQLDRIVVRIFDGREFEVSLGRCDGSWTVEEGSHRMIELGGFP